jgi:S1-C subfamily serine protease
MSGIRRLLVAVVALTVVAATAGCASSSANPGRATTSLEDQFIEVVNEVSTSVVAIQTDGGLGSGVIFDSAGDIVTNAHVVLGARAYKVYLASGQSYEATLVGTYGLDDLAVLRIAAPGLRPATFGDSDHVRAGTIVMAIGSPLGLQGSVTEGIVSAVGRLVSEPNGVALPPVIQTSASINPGNSGGALVDLDSQVVGVTTLAAQDPQAGGTAPGIGFAIPSNIVKDIAAQLIRSGKVTNSHRAYLGVQVATAAGGAGAAVYAVVPGGPADKAGVRLSDVIVSVEGRNVADQPSLASVLSALSPGETVEVVVIRASGSSVTLAVTLGELPS